MKIAVFPYGRVGNTLTRFIVEAENTAQLFFYLADGDPYLVATKELLAESRYTILKKREFKGRKLAEQLSGTDLGILLWFPYILKKHIIESTEHGFINLHPSLLPYNRGKHPWYWNIVEDTPAGVSIHLVDPDIDCGPVLWQESIHKDISTTANEIYQKSESQIVKLFCEHYDDIVNLRLKPIEQNASLATYHVSSELDKHSEIKLDSLYTARQLINIIRARTLPGPSAFFYEDGKKYEVRIDIRCIHE